MNLVTYNELTRWRSECVRTFGTFDQLPLVASAYEECRRVYAGGIVLDVGAGTERVLQKILGLNGAAYTSRDSDSAGQFDYASFDEVPTGIRFSLIVLNQVLEHLRIDEAMIMMRQVGEPWWWEGTRSSVCRTPSIPFACGVTRPTSPGGRTKTSTGWFGRQVSPWHASREVTSIRSLGIR